MAIFIRVISTLLINFQNKLIIEESMVAIIVSIKVIQINFSLKNENYEQIPHISRSMHSCSNFCSNQ